MQITFQARILPRRQRVESFSIDAPMFDSQGQSLYATIVVKNKVFRLDHVDLEWLFQLVGSICFSMPKETRKLHIPDQGSTEIEFCLESNSVKFRWEFPIPDELLEVAKITQRIYDFACEVERTRTPI
jgi:hypothetical protein